MKAFRPRQAGTTELSFDLSQKTRLRSDSVQNGVLNVENAQDAAQPASIHVSPDSFGGEIRFGGQGGTSAEAALIANGIGFNMVAGDAADGGGIGIYAGGGYSGAGGTVSINAGVGGLNGDIQLWTQQAELLINGQTGAFHINGNAGSPGQVLTSNGPTARPTWQTPPSGGGGSLVPFYIPLGDTFTVALNCQGLFTLPITVDGTLVIDGILVEV